MGSCLSCRSSPTFKNIIRVVHRNGYVEEFEYPVSVRQVIGQVSSDFLFTTSQLLCPGAGPLKPDALLQPGQIYFLLPYSIFQADASPLDLATLVRNLTSVAKSRRHQAKSPGCSLLESHHQRGTSPSWNTMATSPSRNHYDQVVMKRGGSVGAGMKWGVKRSCGGSSTWKPALDTIRERSLTRRSESQALREIQLESLLEA